MAYLEELYPGRISEACLIDVTGTEIARVVDGMVAPASELSTEAAAPFFGLWRWRVRWNGAIAGPRGL